jgi:hypothetical protein
MVIKMLRHSSVLIEHISQKIIISKIIFTHINKIIAEIF